MLFLLVKKKKMLLLLLLLSYLTLLPLVISTFLYFPTHESNTGPEGLPWPLFSSSIQTHHWLLHAVSSSMYECTNKSLRVPLCWGAYRTHTCSQCPGTQLPYHLSPWPGAGRRQEPDVVRNRTSLTRPSFPSECQM